jgi:hypothetical protein
MFEINMERRYDHRVLGGSPHDVGIPLQSCHGPEIGQCQRFAKGGSDEGQEEHGGRKRLAASE